MGLNRTIFFSVNGLFLFCMVCNLYYELTITHYELQLLYYQFTTKFGVNFNTSLCKILLLFYDFYFKWLVKNVSLIDRRARENAVILSFHFLTSCHRSEVGSYANSTECRVCHFTVCCFVFSLFI